MLQELRTKLLKNFIMKLIKINNPPNMFIYLYNWRNKFEKRLLSSAETSAGDNTSSARILGRYNAQLFRLYECVNLDPCSSNTCFFWLMTPPWSRILDALVSHRWWSSWCSGVYSSHHRLLSCTLRANFSTVCGMWHYCHHCRLSARYRFGKSSVESMSNSFM